MRPALPWRLAAPSWVVPGTAAENCAFLAGKVDEVALLLLQAEACLAYGPGDLPGSPIPGLACHAHLPVDLDWSGGPGPAFEVAGKLAAKVAHLAPRAHVLHPPDDPALLAGFLGLWRSAGLDPGLVLVENVRGNDLAGCLEVLYHAGCGVCMDLGHALAHGQRRLLADEAALGLMRMVHLSAPGPRAEHLGLDRLDHAGREALRGLLERLAPGSTVVLELFHWPTWEKSLSLFLDWVREWGLEAG